MTILEGTPNREIHPLMKALATVSAVISVRGIASGERENRSIHVRRYVNPLDSGSGLTMSMWMISNRVSGVGNDKSGAVVCL